ncbi:hypothetical protein SAMN05216389_10734 [Oceanobacillus limi]|uniref:DUF4179 domain-containing protein n=1 Tax=Oceanobacillus limi TaxID=930131 RepID=A0A1I0CQU4_9BACI|nr:hypothetical protein [Oceanobacillus limi]SET22089.1 hypothetical protein SAMN05216389_10734 [Oceanobacillus limi]
MNKDNLDKELESMPQTKIKPEQKKRMLHSILHQPVNQKRNNRWKKHWILQTLTAAIVIGLFIVGIQIYQGESPFFSTSDEEEIIDSKPEENTDWSNWISAESIIDVDAFYQSTIPGLRIAEELNQVVEINQKYPLNNDVFLYIDKAWYHEDKIHLFYSMDLSDDEIVTNNLETGVLYDFLLHKENDSTIKLKTDSPSPWSGVVFNDVFNSKVYRVSTITLEDAKQLAGREQLTTTFSIDLYHNEVTLPEIQLPVAYGNQEISSSYLKEWRETMNSTIVLERYDKGADKGYIYGSIESEMGQEIENLHGTITLNNGDRIPIKERIIDLHENEFVIEITELTTESVSMEFDYLSMIEKEDTIDIPIDVSEYEGSVFGDPVEETMKVGVDNVYNTNIILRSLTFDDKGLTVGISTEKVNSNGSSQLNISSITPEKHNERSDSLNIISAVDNHGESAKEHDLLSAEHHQLSSGDELENDILTFGIAKGFIEGKEEITAHIRRLSIGEEFEWNVEIPKQE